MILGWHAWVGLGLLLMAAELLLPGAFLVWLGAAAVGTGILVLLFAPGLVATILAFLLLLALGVGLSLRFLRPRAAARHPDPGGLNTPASGLLGRTAVVVSVSGDGGRVRLGDSDWPAEWSGEAAPGDRVTVTGVRGMTLQVRPGA